MKGYYTNVIRYKGTFDYHGLYCLMREFFSSRKFDWWETKYKDKGKEAEFKWTCESEWDEYHLVQFKIVSHMWDYEKIEVQELGKRKTLMKARIQIDLSAMTIYDYNSIPVYGKSKFDQFLKKIQDKYIRRREAEEHWDVLTLGMQQDLMAKIKQFLKMDDS